MAQDRKKQVSGEIPFHFMQEMGHSPRAMEQFFDLPYQARQVLTDAVCISDEPEERRETALKSLANGGEGYANGSDRFSARIGCTLRCSRFAVFAKIRCLDIFYF